jgi:hypothetical protein
MQVIFSLLTELLCRPTSAVVGWIPIKLAKSDFFALSFTPIANPWVISPAFGESTWKPTTHSYKWHKQLLPIFLQFSSIRIACVSNKKIVNFISKQTKQLRRKILVIIHMYSYFQTFLPWHALKGNNGSSLVTLARHKVVKQLGWDCVTSTCSVITLVTWDCAIAQAVSHWLPKVTAQVSSQNRSCRICGRQSGTGVSYCWVLRFPQPIFILSAAPHSLIVPLSMRHKS